MENISIVRSMSMNNFSHNTIIHMFQLHFRLLVHNSHQHNDPFPKIHFKIIKDSILRFNAQKICTALTMTLLYAKLLKLPKLFNM